LHLQASDVRRRMSHRTWSI